MGQNKHGKSLREVELFSNEIEDMNSRQRQIDRDRRYEQQRRLQTSEPGSLLHELSLGQAQKEVTYSPQIPTSSLSLPHSSLLLERAMSLFYHLSKSILTSWCNYVS